MDDVLVWDVTICKHDLINALSPAKLLDAVLGNDGVLLPDSADRPVTVGRRDCRSPVKATTMLDGSSRYTVLKLWKSPPAAPRIITRLGRLARAKPVPQMQVRGEWRKRLNHRRIARRVGACGQEVDGIADGQGGRQCIIGTIVDDVRAVRGRTRENDWLAGFSIVRYPDGIMNAFALCLGEAIVPPASRYPASLVVIAVPRSRYLRAQDSALATMYRPARSSTVAPSRQNRV